MAEFGDERGPGEEKPGEARASDEGAGQASGGVAGEPVGGAGGEPRQRQRRPSFKEKKTSLEDQLKEMKAKKLEMKRSRESLQKEIKLAQRKKRRLKKRANLLNTEDLFELCRMKAMDPASMEAAHQQGAEEEEGQTE